ncbi:hypothetical protein CR513_05948, partial [Mucuna pruriens]
MRNLGNANPQDRERSMWVLGKVELHRKIYIPIKLLLHINQIVEWIENYQEAFEKIKQYLQKPPILPLIIYLIMHDKSMGCMLGQHDESNKKECVIYYLSKNYTTWLVSKMDLINYIFKNLTLTGLIARWQVLLPKNDIVYVTQKATKGSTLAEYLALHPIVYYQSM